MRTAVDKVTPTPRGTVLLPFQDLKGSYVVVEITVAQWRQILADVNHAWAVIRHQRGVQEDIRDIDRWDGVT